MTIQIDIGPGELWDRITILELKAARLGAAAARAGVRLELDALHARRAAAGLEEAPPVAAMVESLRAVNRTLWDLEDQLREHERRGHPAARVAACALAIRRENDARAALKRRIDDHHGSPLRDEKHYARSIEG